MIDNEIERNQATIAALADAFYGSTYAPHITGYAGLYTITRKDGLTVTVTQAEIDRAGVHNLVGGIIAGWDK